MATDQHAFHMRGDRSFLCDYCEAPMNSRAAEVTPCPKRKLEPGEIEARLGVPEWIEKPKAKGRKR